MNLAHLKFRCMAAAIGILLYLLFAVLFVLAYIYLFHDIQTLLTTWYSWVIDIAQ